MKQVLFLIFLLSILLTSSRAWTFKQNEENETAICNLIMFGGDSNALRACQTAYALQHNWYPSPIAGLFSYQTWNGFDGFWQDGTALETLANFMHYGNNTMYKTVVTGSIRDVYSLLEAYAPQPSYDDMAWYGLSYARIHEILGPGGDPNGASGFLYSAKQIYDWVWSNGWDASQTCGGGVWFDQTEGSKQTVENAQMLLLGSKLYRLTNDSDILPKVKQTLQFIMMNQLIDNATYLVADGVKSNCSSNTNYGPTYNMGLMIGALVEAASVLNRSADLIPLAHKIAQATIRNSTKNGVLVEYCSPKCDDDAKMFKGIFVRNIRYLIDHTSASSHASTYQDELTLYKKFLQHNSDVVWASNRCQPEIKNCSVMYKDGKSLRKTTVGPVFGMHYGGPYNGSAPMQQTSVLDLFVSTMGSDVRCAGDGCSYDPPIPQPHPLTCDDNPCPPYQPCCAWENEYYTCCESSQKCQNGECI